MRKDRAKLIEDSKAMGIKITPVPYSNPMKPSTFFKMVEIIPSTEDD